MDGDDEPAMAYFLPNGIADDSPPKRSRVKASFGPIGGRSAATSGSSGATSPGSAATVSTASGAQDPRLETEFTGLHTRPRPTLDPSPFGGSGASLSPRPTNFLLSDLGGEIHTPRAQREIETARSSSPFGYTGAFGPSLESRHGGSFGAGAIRSPSSMFDRGQEAAKSFSVSPRAAGFDEPEAPLYRGYLSPGDSDRFGGMHTWPSTATETTQPRRILQRPPGLAGPPGLTQPSMDNVQPRIRMGSSGGSGLMQQQFGPFSPPSSSPMAASSAGRGVFSGNEEFGPSLLPGLRLSSGVFGDRDDGRGVSNPELAELNTQSIKVGEVDRMRGRREDDRSAAPWSSREPTTSRRIDVQARYKAPRSPKKSRDGRKKSEGRSELRSRALEFSMDTVGAFTPESPVRSRRGRKMASPTTNKYDSPPTGDGRTSSDQRTPRGKRRNQLAGRDIATPGVGGNDSKRRGMANQNEEFPSSRSSPPALEASDSPAKQFARDSAKTKRKDGTAEVKTSSRSAPTRKNSNRGVEKPTRRQVYREKQVKERKSESPAREESAAVSEPSSTASPSPKGSDESSESQSPDARYREEKQEDIPEDTALTPTASTVTTTESSEAVQTVVEASEKPRPEEKPCSEEERGLLTDRPKNDKASEAGEDANTPSSTEQSEQLPAPPAKKAKQKSTINSAPETPAVSREPPAQPVEKKQTAKEPRGKKDKKKAARGKKEKRSSFISKAADALNDSTSEAQDKLLEALASTSTPLSTRVSKGLRDGLLAATSAGFMALLNTRRGCIWLATRLNVKGVLSTSFSYLESVLAVLFSVVLLLSLHAASWFIRIHRVAFRAVLTHRHIGFCFAFLYGFPFLVQYVFPWAPPWAPVCLWYAFLVQLFCTNGPTAMVTTFRVILPLVFLVEGISHHSFLLDLNGAELLLASFIVSAVKTSNLCSPIFFLSLATQCLLAVFLGSELVVQWMQLALALYSLHVMAVSEDEWSGVADDDDEVSCNPVAMHHSIADYNRHTAPSSAVSIQKAKRLDRRALAYVRGRKLR